MLISDNSSAEETEQYVYAEGGLEYAYSSDTEVASVISYDGIAKDVKILSKITVDGVDYAVTSIAADVFKGKALESIVIEEGVTAIPASEFEGCTALKTVSIPLSVTTVGDAAFKGCTALKTVTIAVNGDIDTTFGTRNLGVSAFENCTALESITSHPSLVPGNACFKNTGLKDATICLASFGKPGDIFSKELFMNCVNLTSVEIIKGGALSFVISGDSVFEGCVSLKSVPIPDVKDLRFRGFIGSKVFMNSGVESFVVPNSAIASIGIILGPQTFDGCKNLKTFVVDGKINSVSGPALTEFKTTFDGCNIELMQIGEWQSLDFGAFVGCNVDLLKLGNVQYIGTISSKYVDKFTIKAVDFGGLLSTSLSDDVKNDSSMAIVSTIPGLEKITQSGENSKYGMIDGAVYRLDYNNAQAPTAPVKLIICSPDIASLEIPETVTAIGANAFDGCKVLERVSFPESVATYSYAGSDVSFKDASGTAVGSDVENFAGRTYMTKDGIDGLALCPVLTFIADDKEVGKVTYTWDGKAVIPEVPAKTGFTGVWEDYSAVTGDKEIKAVYTQITFVDEANGVKYLVDEKGNAVVNEWIDSVMDVKILSKITVDGVDYAVTSIAADVFKGKALESIVIEEGVTAIPASEFEGCTALKTVSIPLSVTTVGDAAFKGCTALKTVTIAVNGDIDTTFGTRNLGVSAFENCTALESITSHPSLVPGNACFKNTGLKDATICLASFGKPGDIFSKELFMNCVNLTSVEIIKGGALSFVISGDSVFEGCVSLKSVPIPDVKDLRFRGFIGSKVFMNSGVESFVVPNSAIASIGIILGPQTFDGCKNLKTFVVDGKINSVSGPALTEFKTTFDGCNIELMQIGEWQSLDFGAFVGCNVDLLKLGNVQYIGTISSKYVDKFTIKAVDFGGLLSTSLSDDVKNDSSMAIVSTIPGLEKITQSGENSKYGMIDGAVYRLDYNNAQAPTAPVKLIICSPDIASLEIPETVTAIGANAFDGCKVLERVSFPESVATYSYAGSDVSFKDASGTAVGSDVENFAGRTYMTKDGIDGLALCPVLTFIADDKEVGKVTYTWDGKAVIPEVPAKTGFTGVWEDYSAVTGDKEIKAVYTPNKHTVTYMVNGTQFGDVETYDFGTEVIVKADYQKEGYESTSWSAEGIKVTDGKFVLGDADVVFSATSVMIVSAGTDGAAEIVLPVGETTFKPSEGTKTVTVKMAENTSVEIADAADLVGKVVVSEVKEITSTSGISGKAYEFTFTADGTQYNGKMEVTLPYTKEDGKVPVVYFWDGSKSTEMKVLSSTDTSVTFETDHNSEYIVASESPSKEDGSNIILYMGILIVIGFAIAMLVGFNFYRRKA